MAPFYISRHYETVKNSHFLFFFRNFSMSLSLLHFFLIFCNKLDFQKAQKVSPSTILRTLRFSSLGYGADFRRFRLVCSCSILTAPSLKPSIEIYLKPFLKKIKNWKNFLLLESKAKKNKLSLSENYKTREFFKNMF